MEFESLVKVFLATSGTREQMLAPLEQSRADAEALLSMGRMIQGAYLAGQAPQQEEQVHVRALVFDFLLSYGEMIRSWAERAHAEVETWQDVASEGKADRAIAIIRDHPALARLSQ